MDIVILEAVFVSTPYMTQTFKAEVETRRIEPPMDHLQVKLLGVRVSGVCEDEFVVLLELVVVGVYPLFLALLIIDPTIGPEDVAEGNGAFYGTFLY